MDSLRNNNRGFVFNGEGNGWFTPEHNSPAMHIQVISNSELIGKLPSNNT